MWLESKRQHNLTWNEPNDLIVPCRMDVWASADFETHEPGQPEAFIVGRFLADEIHRYYINEWGENVWDAADADSAGLEAAWASLLDEAGQFREEDFESIADPVVYVYRFALHPNSAECRLAVMDLFCRTFDDDALILAQLQTTILSETEFEELGFDDLPPTRFPAPPGFAHIDRKTRFKARMNCTQASYSVRDYPQDVPPAEAGHTEWLEAQGRWTGLC